ncbi:MAG: hypothetical protein AB1758_31845, partial [Candidatus Eremiobacterota bacterium]
MSDSDRARGQAVKLRSSRGRSVSPGWRASENLAILGAGPPRLAAEMQELEREFSTLVEELGVQP